MEALFKRYFWVINLLALSLVAWLIAQTIVDFLATKYLTVQPEGPSYASSALQGPVLTKADGASLGKTLTDRSPFNVDPKEVVKPPKDPDCVPKCDGKVCGADGCEGTCGECGDGEKCNAEGQCEQKAEEAKECELDITLVGTMTNPANPDQRFANLMIGGSNSEMVTTGTEVAGKATVVDIIPKMVYLREGDNLCHISMWSKPKPKAAAKANPRIRNTGKPLSRPNPKTSAKPKGPKRGKAFDYSSGVKKQDEFNYAIDRQMLDEQLTDLTQLGMQARVIPNYRKGKYEGFKLVGVRPGSLYRAIGIRSGDIVRSINGKAINSPNKAMELFTQLKSASNIELQV
ncbi:MAG: type II secretory pathway component PulC, partial [Myxococcota bacterium]